MLLETYTEIWEARWQTKIQKYRYCMATRNLLEAEENVRLEFVDMRFEAISGGGAESRLREAL